MAVALRQSRRFDASSPVTRYWLANCVGFSLSGGGHGTVERIVADVNPYDPSTLEVRTSWHRVRRIPTSAIIARWASVNPPRGDVPPADVVS